MHPPKPAVPRSVPLPPFPKTLTPPKKPILKLVMNHDEADKVALTALQSRVEDLPDSVAQTSKLGKKTSLMTPRHQALDHPAGPMLNDWATRGCPVDCGPDWPLEKLEAALDYGSHPSAKIPEARKCLLEETKDKVDKGFARVIQWKDLKADLPPNLKLSPVAMIPHKSRAFRCILDLSFNLKLTRKQHADSVNETTVKLAPEAAMAQLGVALRRIITTMDLARQKGTSLLFAKLDIKDGFWRLMVSDKDAWNFCYIIPPSNSATPKDEIQIVVPNCLQMGWCESPPFFCAASETARDVIASLLGTDLPPHPFEAHMLPSPADAVARPIQDLTSTISLLEVFVDDFIGLTDNTSRAHLENFSRAMLHGIHTVFPPPSVTGHHVGGDPISEKKLKKLEGLWEHVKEVLGWMLDGANYTIKLPDAKIKKIVDTLKKLGRQRTIRVLDFQKIAGTLHHASMGIPGGRGLFTTIWAALNSQHKGYIKVTADLKEVFRDFDWLFRQIANHPINVAQLVARLPETHGYTDACKYGAGGVWIINTSAPPAFYFWTIAFSQEIVSRLATHKLSINDLEMAGVFYGWLVLEYLMPDLAYHQVGIQCDNTSTVHWSRKFTARSLVSGHLLRALAFRQQLRSAAPLLVASIPGDDNTMADVASRYHSDLTLQSKAPTLTSYFNTYFKQPSSWIEFRLPQKLISRVTSSLLGTQLSLELWRRLPKPGKDIGSTGVATQPPSSLTPSSKIRTPLSETPSSQVSLLGSGRATTAKAVKSKFKESLMPFQPSARPLNWLASPAPSIGITKSTRLPSNVASKECDDKTPLPYHK